MATTQVNPAAPAVTVNYGGNRGRNIGRTLRREGFGIFALIVLALFIIGPILSVVLWAFAERWAYPSLIPTQWGFSYWQETLNRADVIKGFSLSLGLSVVVTVLS